MTSVVQKASSREFNERILRLLVPLDDWEKRMQTLSVSVYANLGLYMSLMGECTLSSEMLKYITNILKIG